jgi:hypothetical protein
MVCLILIQFTTLSKKAKEAAMTFPSSCRVTLLQRHGEHVDEVRSCALSNNTVLRYKKIIWRFHVSTVKALAGIYQSLSAA